MTVGTSVGAGCEYLGPTTIPVVHAAHAEGDVGSALDGEGGDVPASIAVLPQRDGRGLVPALW